LKERTKGDSDYAYEFVGKLRWNIKEGDSPTAKLDARKNFKTDCASNADVLVVWRLHNGERAWEAFLAEVERILAVRPAQAVKGYVDREFRRMYDEVQADLMKDSIVIDDVDSYTIRYDKTARKLYIRRI
jgi:hypothetical protein